MFKEFKQFAIKGNALDLAVGVIIGAAFGQIVNSLVQDIFNPVFGLIIGRVDFSAWRIGLPGESAIMIGSFINAAINFVIVAFAVFLMVKQINRFKAKPAPQTDTKLCPYCFGNIDKKATRCPHCTSGLEIKEKTA